MYYYGNYTVNRILDMYIDNVKNYQQYVKVAKKNKNKGESASQINSEIKDLFKGYLRDFTNLKKLAKQKKLGDREFNDFKNGIRVLEIISDDESETRRQDLSLSGFKMLGDKRWKHIINTLSDMIYNGVNENYKRDSLKQINEYFFKEDDTIGDLAIMFLSDLTDKDLIADVQNEWIDELNGPFRGEDNQRINNNVRNWKKLIPQVTKIESQLKKEGWFDITCDDLVDGRELYDNLMDYEDLLTVDWNEIDNWEEVFLPQMKRVIQIFEDILNNLYGTNPMNENKRSIKSLQEKFLKNANRNLLNENRVSRGFVTDWVEEHKDEFNPQRIKIYTKNKHKLIDRLMENYDIDDFNDVEDAFDELDDEFDDILSSVDDLSEDDFDEIANTLAQNIETLSKKAKQIKSKRK